MIDFSPNLYQSEPELPVSPTTPRTPMMSPPPMPRRRSSENAMQRRASMSEYRTAQSRLSKVPTVNEAPPTEATIRGVSLAIHRYSARSSGLHTDGIVLFPLAESRAISGTIPNKRADAKYEHFRDAITM